MPLHEEHKKRRARNWAIAGFLLLLVVLFYLATIFKMQVASHVGG